MKGEMGNPVGGEREDNAEGEDRGKINTNAVCRIILNNYFTLT